MQCREILGNRTADPVRAWYLADTTCECNKSVQATRRLVYARRRSDGEKQELPAARVTAIAQGVASWRQ
jgi:hypothetical protein